MAFETQDTVRNPSVLAFLFVNKVYIILSQPTQPDHNYHKTTRVYFHFVVFHNLVSKSRVLCARKRYI